MTHLSTLQYRMSLRLPLFGNIRKFVKVLLEIQKIILFCLLRFGHALIQPFTFRLNESFQPIPEGNLLLRDSFFAPQRYYYEGGMDPLMRGLFGVPAKIKMPREIMNDELTEKLFHIVRSVSQDLAALNIQVLIYIFIKTLKNIIRLLILERKRSWHSGLRRI